MDILGSFMLYAYSIIIQNDVNMLSDLTQIKNQKPFFLFCKGPLRQMLLILIDHDSITVCMLQGDPTRLSIVICL